MNIDIRLSLGFFGHPKTKKLRKRLGDCAVLCLLRLWMWAAANRPDGRLSGMDGEDVELAADWDGEEEVFVRALIDCGWLDAGDEGYAIHGWDEHQAYASKSEERHTSAKKAAEARWGKKRAMQEQCEQQCGNDADAMRNDAEPMRDACEPQCGNDAPSCEPHADGNAPKHQDTKLINTPLLPKGSIPPRGETRTKKPKEDKLPFGELGNVLLTAREREKLDERFGIEGAQERIDSLDAYIGSKGAKYDSHYATILNWERMDDKRRQTAATVPRAAPVATTVAQQRSLERQVMAEMLLEDRKQREEAKYDANGSRIVTQPDGSQLALPPGW